MIQHLPTAPGIAANPSELADDTLHGAEAIAEYVYGDREKQHVRKVYHNASSASANRLPTFRLGAMICARRSKILQWIEAQEARSTTVST
jgi:hypothetical protein